MSPINRRVQQDAAEIMGLVAKSLHDKYVAPFEEAIKSRGEVLDQNPPPEIGLLSALKPFVDDRCCSVIDKLVSSYSLATLAKAMAEDLVNARGEISPGVLAGTRPSAERMAQVQFPVLSILLPLIILLFFTETH
ncbi:MAG: hypothetical protein GX918_02280 [Clostridiales bacterium]|nr:hypothetical protein [Clostridiales bacterium]